MRHRDQYCGSIYCCRKLDATCAPKVPADANGALILLVRADDLKGLPPATIIGSEIEPLRITDLRVAESELIQHGEKMAQPLLR
jgi:acetyl esterase/lipase